MLRAYATPLPDPPHTSLAFGSIATSSLALFEKVSSMSQTLPENAYVAAINVESPGIVADLITSHLPLDVRQRQAVLETLDIEQRLHTVATLLMHELDVLELEHQLRTEVEQEVDRTQREVFLREQLKAIQRELGQSDPFVHELNDLEARIEASQMPQAVRMRALEDLSRSTQCRRSLPSTLWCARI
jgi:ATP-dependent Lon protease